MSLYTEFDHYHQPVGGDGTSLAYLEALRDEAESTDTPIGWSEAFGGFWLVTRYDTVQEIMMQPETFSNTGCLFPHYGTASGGPMMLSEYDPPLHKKYRRLVQAAFTQRSALELTEEVRAQANMLIDRFVEDGETDLCKTIADEIPSRLTAQFLGLPPEDGELYRTWTWAIAHANDPGSAERMTEMSEYFLASLAERRAHPRDDVMSALLEAEIDGETLTDSELCDFFVILLVAGIDNVSISMATGFWRLGWDVELRRRLAQRPELYVTMVDEVLRYYTSTILGRIVMKPVEVGGVKMKPGQQLMLSFPIANRDSRVFDHPDAFIVDRTPNRHLALGHGIHKCLGIHLVRMSMRVAYQEVNRRMPEWGSAPDPRARLDDGHHGRFRRAPDRLPPGT